MQSEAEAKPVILVVDDVPQNLDVLKGGLADAYQVRLAVSGERALRAAQIEPLPDLILLDVMMPDIDGFEVCRQLKANPLTAEIPVLFVTAKSEMVDELHGLALGAVDYISKPISIPIVQARVRTQLALRRANCMLQRHTEQLLRERNVIERIIIKMRDADHLNQRHLRYVISPVEKTAGDMLLATLLPDGRQWVLLGDFTGHGLPAAIGGPLVAYIFHTMATQNGQAIACLEQLNEQLCQRLPREFFLAFTLVEVSPARDTAMLWIGGIPSVYHFAGALHSIDSTLLPLGIFADECFANPSARLSLQAGERLYVCTDGIVEASGKSDEMFGDARLAVFLKALCRGEQQPEDLMSLLDAYVGGREHTDDITLVEIEI
ncbi:SpoIIE family protein phosphatase [Magnetococcus marinus]|uniref:SpoIIE family protein phosphatase n=1 Tax=Magnetococcus marinus TaxID=1124597 RepID=UPI0002F8D7F8|nr:SpoIIE family protein phosphatase [Magnetococcus marinus]